jgi:hypothetical protein
MPPSCNRVPGRGVDRLAALPDERTPAGTVRLDGAWFPDAFVGPMASLMRFDGESPDLPTSVEDAWHTMSVKEACYQSSERGATPKNL